jgi:hypothetical protein
MKVKTNVKAGQEQDLVVVGAVQNNQFGNNTQRDVSIG